MPAIKRTGRAVTMRELIEKDGVALLGSDKPCPHCGKPPKPFEVVTPGEGWVLQFLIPCTCRSRR